jgi:hypothetical protein
MLELPIGTRVRVRDDVLEEPLRGLRGEIREQRYGDQAVYDVLLYGYHPENITRFGPGEIERVAA